jgi:hypothetical protein
MTTAIEFITDSLIDINALAPGQVLPPNNAAVALRKLNDMLDSLSLDKGYVYTTVENIFSWTPNQFKYSVGNPVGGTFSGTMIIGTPTISGVTVPSNLVIGGDLSDTQSQVSVGTTVLAFNAVAQTVTMSQNALSTVTPAEQFTYTTPGNIKIPRPLRLSPTGYTRITASGNNNLDYWFETTMSMDRYNEFGLKFNPGPWPLIVAYQPTFPLATLWAYPNPNITGEVHLFTDLIFTDFTSLTQDVTLPQGYTRSLKKLLSLELAPSYGKTPSNALLRACTEARAFIRALNQTPVETLRYDDAIVRSQTTDAGWIVHGGFTGFICGVIGLEMLKWFM